MIDSTLVQDATRIAKDVCALVARVLPTQTADPADYKKVAMLAHLLRMLRYAQGVSALAGDGKLEPACALVRPLLEMGWVLLALQNHPDEFDHWIKQGHGEQAKALAGLKRLGDLERPAAMTIDALSAAIAALPKGTPYNAWHWADRSGAPASYATLYRQLSDASHAGPWATFAYLATDSAGLPIGVDDAELEELPADCLCITSALMLDALRAVSGTNLTAAQLLEIERAEQEVHGMYARGLAAMRRHAAP